MVSTRRKIVSLSRRAEPSALPSGVIGRFRGFTDDGHALVTTDPNDDAPVVARTIMPSDDQLVPGAPVVLVFEDGDASRPIIVGIPRDPARPQAPPTGHPTLATQQDVVVTMKSLVVNADREIVLRCGAGSVTLRADGTIVVRGTKLLSRASGTNRIKGASVKIN